MNLAGEEQENVCYHTLEGLFFDPHLQPAAVFSFSLQ